MSESNHTPLPWTVEESCVEGFGWDIPELPEGGYRDSRFGNKADADFIALAANCHDELVAACLVALNELKAYYRANVGTEATDTCTAEIYQLTTALTKAGKPCE